MPLFFPVTSAVKTCHLPVVMRQQLDARAAVGRDLGIIGQHIGLSLSLIFLRRPLTDMTSGLAERREARLAGRRDEDIEDAAADAARGVQPSGS